MKDQPNELFDIVKSLTPQEKTFFKAYFLKSKDSAAPPSFLILFDALNELETYDRQKLKTLLDKKGFSSHYFKAQTYLTEAILKALTEYHSETENTIKIGQLLQQVNILLNKNLRKTAKKYFDRAVKLAEAGTLYEYRLVLDHLQFSFHEKNSTWMDRYLSSVSDHLNTFGLETELRKAGYDALEHSIEHFDKHVPLSVIKKKVAGTLNRLDALSKKLRLNNFSKSRYYNAKAQCLMILNRPEVLKKSLDEYFHYLEGLPNTSAFFAKTVLHGYNSIIISHAYVKNFERVEKTFEAARKYFHSLSGKICTPDISSLYYSYILENMLALFNEMGEPEKTIAAWEKNKKEIIRFDKKHVVSLYTLNVALAEFMLGNFHSCIRLAARIPFDTVRPAVYCEAKLLQTLSHHELNNFDILSSLVREARRSYTKSNILKPAEKILFRFFEKQAGRFHSRTEEKKALVLLRDNIREEERSSGDRTTTGSINILLWLESKISSRPFAEVVRAH